MDQTELDQAGIDAKKRAVDAAKEKDELAGHIDATQHAVELAKDDLSRQKEEFDRQYLDNSKPTLGGDPTLNTAPAPEAVPEPDVELKPADNKPAEPKKPTTK